MRSFTRWSTFVRGQRPSAAVSASVLSSGIATDAVVPQATLAKQDDIESLAAFIKRHKKIFVMTGAGCSTESGIPDYRSPNGSYSKGHKPMTWQKFSRSEAQRQRYWSRSMAGWPFMMARKPNAAHEAVAILEMSGKVELLVTQNVDRLHHAAGSQNVCELHGTVFEIECAGCGTISSRDDFQRRLLSLNPQWASAIGQAQDSGSWAPSNSNRPDGDVELEHFDHSTLRIPKCNSCSIANESVFLKPAVVLFGENVPPARVQSAMASEYMAIVKSRTRS